MGLDSVAAQKEGYLPPDWTDEQIMNTFTPVERRFYEWNQRGNGIGDFAPAKIEEGLQAAFPDVENVQYQHLVFMFKWGNRLWRRWAQPVPEVNMLKIIKETNCRDPNSVSSTSLTLQTRRVPDMLLGESSFGGCLTGYAVAIDPTFLQPDTSNPRLEHGSTDRLLSDAVIAIDINSPWPDIQPQSLQLLSSPEKRRRENRSSGEDSGVSGVSGVSSISQRSTTSEDFMEGEPHVFFQLGELMACNDFGWLGVRDKTAEEAAKSEDWEETGYSVLIKLNKRGYPTGPVFVAYAYCRHENYVTGEIEWRDKYYRELPHIRRLNENCKTKFYLAQIASTLENLKHGKEFDFDVKCVNRCTVQGAKVVGWGVSEKVVPRTVCDSMGDDKRAKMGSDRD